MSRNYRNGSVILDIDETKELKININVKVPGIKLKYCFRRQNPKLHNLVLFFFFFSRWAFGFFFWEITTFGKTVNIFMYVEMIKVQLNLLLEIFKGS